jgi:hypothetical protein
MISTSYLTLFQEPNKNLLDLPPFLWILDGSTGDLKKLDELETLYNEAKYSLSLLRLFKTLKAMRIIKDKDIYDL